jgi:hypothetical protein
MRWNKWLPPLAPALDIPESTELLSHPLLLNPELMCGVFSE